MAQRSPVQPPTTAASTSPPPPGATPGLAYGGAMITYAFAGALITRTAWSLCINPRPRTTCELALVVASIAQSISLIITGYLTATAFLPPPPPLPQFLLRTATNWSHMVAVILATYICLKRAQAIWVVAPRTANVLSPILSVAMIGAAGSARIAGTLSEFNALTRVPDPASLFSAQQFLRALVNFTAAAFALFSEAYVTSIIVRFRRRSATARRASVASRDKNAWAWLAIPTSSADRMRLAYAVLICLTFLTQAALQIAVMLRLTRFAPFHAMGWSLILIRIIEFRSELLASVLVQQPGGGNAGGPHSASRGPAGVSTATTTSAVASVGGSASTSSGGKGDRQVAVRGSRGYMLSSPATTAAGNGASSFGGPAVTTSTTTTTSASGLYRSWSSVGHDVNLAIKPSPTSSASNADMIPLARLIPGPPRPLQQLQHPVGHDPRRLSTAPGEVFSYYTMAVASVAAGSIGPAV